MTKWSAPFFAPVPTTTIQVLLDAVRENRTESIERLCSKLLAFDVETHCIQPGLPAPPLVCGSLAWFDAESGEIVTQLVDKVGAREAFRGALADPDVVLVGANIVFDMLVMAQDAARLDGTDLFPAIFEMYEQGRVYDVQLAQQLHCIAEGTLNKDPRTMKGLVGRYSLGTCVEHVLGRTDAKIRNAWRLRYAELEHVPIDQWPEDARLYPLDDARNTLEVALAQLGAIPKLARHEWGPRGCKHCGTSTIASWCERAGTPHHNLHSIHDQVYTHWAMYLGAAWGFKVDQAEVSRVKARVSAERGAMLPPFVDAGMIRPDGTKNTAVINRMIAEAYDAVGLCVKCDGTAKMPSPKTGNPINCDECSATGLDLSRAPDVPLTPTDKVSRARDVLDESGVEILMDFATYSRLAKSEETYLPYLEDAGNLPLILKPNPILETDRTSYGDKIGQFPRQGGLRECICARCGYVMCSVDYNMGEIITHAQSCIWIVGYSDLADALLANAEPHKKLGAAMLGISFEEFERWFAGLEGKAKQLLAKAARQAAKPGNFGFPGGMGAPKMALQQRRGGPDTECELGPSTLDAKSTRGYRGLRFCILMDGAERCGEIKLKEWKGRPCAPTCARCLDCAERLRETWFAQWSEMKPYFKFTGTVADAGQELELDAGQMIQHVSRIVRGGCNFTATSNGYFQSLLARAAKLWLRRAQREACDRTRRVPDDACAGGRISAYAGLDSPLLGSRIIAFAHDECLPEIPLAQKHDAAMRLSEIGVRALQETCPDLAPVIKAPPAIMPRWYKGAEPMFHRGELVEWTPEHSDPKKCAQCQAAA